MRKKALQEFGAAQHELTTSEFPGELQTSSRRGGGEDVCEIGAGVRRMRTARRRQKPASERRVGTSRPNRRPVGIPGVRHLADLPHLPGQGANAVAPEPIRPPARSIDCIDRAKRSTESSERRNRGRAAADQDATPSDVTALAAQALSGLRIVCCVWLRARRLDAVSVIRCAAIDSVTANFRRSTVQPPVGPNERRSLLLT